VTLSSSHDKYFITGWFINQHMINSLDHYVTGDVSSSTSRGISCGCQAAVFILASMHPRFHTVCGMVLHNGLRQRLAPSLVTQCLGDAPQMPHQIQGFTDLECGD